MQIPILNGVYTDESSDFRVAYPKNMVPVPVSQGISNGYLRPGDGVVQQGGNGPGTSRGGINWNDFCYRVMGSKLVKILEDGTIEEIGDVAGENQVTLDYSFDRLAVAAGEKLYYWDGVELKQVNDVDLGKVLDMIWVDGYFMTTDGEFLVVTELNDPFAVNPLKYGSSEADPDPVKALLKLRNEPHALNRYTMEVLDNVGGSGFPFQRIDGAQVQRGTVGSHTCCVFLENIAFIGGGRNESIAVWMAAGGSSARISTREIDLILGDYTEKVLSQILMEPRVDKGHQHLYIHLPNQTLVYDGHASQVVGEPIWFILTSGTAGLSQYRAKDIVWCYNKWLVGDTVNPVVGSFMTDTAEHWGNLVDWEFSTTIVYNESRGAIFHELELIGLTGRSGLGVDSAILTQYSLDGESWSMPKSIKAGKRGNRNKRLVWLNQGNMAHWRLQRFRGTSDAQIAVARLEARIEPLAV
jgi:hypothetical protein